MMIDYFLDCLRTFMPSLKHALLHWWV